MSPTIDRPRSFAAANPLFIIAAFFAAGILLARVSGINPAVWLVLSCGSAVAAVFGFSAGFRGWLIVAAFVFAGGFTREAARVSIPENDIGRIYDSGAVRDRGFATVEGIVANAPERSPDGVFVRIHAVALDVGGETRSASGVVRFFLPADEGPMPAQEFRAGDRLRISCELTRSGEFRNPGETPRREILDSQGIGATCSVRKGDIPQVLSRAPAGMSDIVPDLRAAAVLRFEELFERRTAGVMIASLLGNKNFLDRETARLFREGGTFHILVISGLHITVIGGFVLLIMRRITRRRFVQFFVSTALLWLFAGAVGGEVPVVRAALMFTVVLAARVIYRSLEPLNGLGLCALVLLITRPDELFDRSFQMTFLSMCALVGFAFPLLAKLREIGEWRPDPRSPFPPETDRVVRILCETLYWSDEKWNYESSGRIWSAALSKSAIRGISGRFWLQKALRWLFEGIVVSLVMQLWMLPVSALYFNRVSYSAVAANLWVSAVIAAETVVAVIAVVVSIVSAAVGKPLVALAESLNDLLLWLPDSLYMHDLAGSRVPAYEGFGAIVYGIYFVPLAILAVALHRWRPVPERPSAHYPNPAIVRAAVIAMTLLALTITFTPFISRSETGRLRVDFIDVGQGDSALVTFPDGRLMLVDGGGRPDFSGRKRDGATPGERFEPDRPSIGETVVSRFLWTRGISRLDYVVATHADADHIEGLADIIANFRVGMLLAGRFPDGDLNFARLMSECRRRSVPVRAVGRGDFLTFGKAQAEFLHPVTDDSEPNSGGNNDSVVIRLSFGYRRILLTGDIERSAERAILAVADLRADVVKVAHHGSRTSSTEGFIASARPAFAVFPVGTRSPYGHPHAEVLRRWFEAGAEILTTGECGTVTISTDGSELHVSRYVKPP